MSTEFGVTKSICLGAKPPTSLEIIDIACSSIPPLVTLDPKIVTQNQEVWEVKLTDENVPDWIPVPRQKRLPSMPTASNVGVGDAAIPVLGTALIRAAVVIRISSLLNEDSGVRMEFIQTLVELLNNNRLPRIEASSSDVKALEKIAAAVYIRWQNLLNHRNTFSALSSLGSSSFSRAGSEGGMKKDEEEKDDQHKNSSVVTLRNTPSEEKLDHGIEPHRAFISEAEYKVFCTGMPLTIARALLTVQAAKTCVLLTDCAAALTVEACALPLAFGDAGISGSGTSKCLSFPGVSQSISNINWLLQDSKITRLSNDQVDSNMMQELVSIPLFNGEMSECAKPVASMVKALICCPTRRLDFPSPSTCPSGNHTDVNSAPKDAHITIIEMAVSSLVERMQSLCVVLLKVIEGCKPSFEAAAAEPRAELLCCPSTLDESLRPLEANPITHDSLERFQQRLPALWKNSLPLSGDSKSLLNLGDETKARGEDVSVVLFDILILQICTSLQLIAHKEVRLYNDAVKKLSQKKKNVSARLNIGKGADKFRECFLDLLDRHLPPNKRDHMISQSEPVLHSALGQLELAAPQIAADLEEVLRPTNQGTRLPKVPKGTQDFSPVRMMLREKIFSMIKGVFQKYGAVQIDTPVFELNETLTGKYGEDQKLIYDLNDQGGEKLSLRYDLTVPFARYVATHNIEKIKRYHIGKVYRRDEPQMARGRFREFYQCDIDIAGQYDTMVADSEILAVLVECLRSLEPAIGNFVVKLNHRLLLDAIMAACGVPEAAFRTICSAIDKLDKEPWANVKTEMTIQKGLPEYAADSIYAIVSLKGSLTELLDTLKSHEALKDSNSAQKALEEIRLLNEYLTALGVSQWISFDLSLARGLDYYTGVIYEAVLVGKDVGSVAAGGRYDKLVGMFAGRDVPAVGVSLGLERIFRIAEQRCNITAPLLQDGCASPDGTAGDAMTATAKKNKKNVKADTVADSSAARCLIRESFTDVLVCSIGQGLTKERMAVTRELRESGISAEYVLNDKQKLVKQLTQVNRQRIRLAIILGENELAAGTLKIKLFNYDSQGCEGGSPAVTEAAPNEMEVKRCNIVAEVQKALASMDKEAAGFDFLV